MKSIIIAAASFLAGSFYTHAQTPKEKVTNAVKDYADAFYYGDSNKIHRSIAINVVKYGYSLQKNKTAYEVEPMTFCEMIDYATMINKKGPSPNLEKFPKQIEVFDVPDQTASAKFTVWWGSDYLLLAKQNDHWMITHVLWQSAPPKS